MQGDRMIDLEAIRARNETRKSGWCYDCKHAHDDSDPKADIDALLAEVERLRELWLCVDCSAARHTDSGLCVKHELEAALS